MKIKDLKPNKANPRKISSKRKAMLKKSLEKYGDLSSIIFNERDQQLVGAHQRTSILPKDAEVVIEQRYDKPTPNGTVAVGYVMVGQERFSYRAVDWDQKTAKAAMIAANRHRGEWDVDMLKEEIAELRGDDDFDPDLIGFDQDEVLALLGPEPETPKDDDSVPPEFGGGAEEPAIRPESEPRHEAPLQAAQPVAETPEEQHSVFDAVEEKTEIEGKRHLVIINCPNDEAKIAIKEKLRTGELLAQHGATIF